MAGKIKRTANFTSEEEEILLNLVNKYKGILECRKTDNTTNHNKAIAWQNVADEYNEAVRIQRDVKHLKNKYENVKKRLKQKYAKETNLAPCKVLRVSEMEDTLEQILGSQVSGLSSEFDYDVEKEVDVLTDEVSEKKCEETLPVAQVIEEGKPTELEPIRPNILKLKKQKKLCFTSKDIVNNVSKWNGKKISLIEDRERFQEEEHKKKIEHMEEKHSLLLVHMQELHDLEKQKKLLEIELLKRQLNS